MAKSFFPFTKELAENENFKTMPPAHRLYFLLLISEYNLRGNFYKSDLEAAVTINTSLDTLRRARRDLQKLGWITTRPGFLENGKRPVATTFYNVCFSQVKEGQFFSPIDRFGTDVIFSLIRKGRINQKQGLMFFYVCYQDTKFRKGEDDFFISKRALVELTGMPEAPAAVLGLNQVEIFGEETLFDIVDVYHKIKVTTHREFADPETDENNRDNLAAYREDIQSKVRIAKQKMTKLRSKPKTKIKESTSPGIPEYREPVK